MFTPGFVNAKHWLPFKTPLLTLVKVLWPMSTSSEANGLRCFDKPDRTPRDRGVTYKYICDGKGRNEEIFYDLHSQPCVTLATFKAGLLR